MTREHYGQELKDLRSSVVAMASMVDKAIDNAVVALEQQDVPLARAGRRRRIGPSTSTAGGPRSKRSC